MLTKYFGVSNILKPLQGTTQRIASRGKRQVLKAATRKLNQRGLTPYQGRHRTFGYFRCPDCGRRWMSGNSWANCWQLCQHCNTQVYPYMQKPLQKVEDGDAEHIDRTKRHPQHLCQKCQELGHYCRRDEGSDDDDSDEE